MSKTVERYLARKCDFEAWPLLGAEAGAWKSVVVIPALGEYPGILDTLEDVARCPEAAETLVIVVVNNRAVSDAEAADVAANQQTLRALAAWVQERLAVAWVNAASPGKELSSKEGVGLARKIGMDHALRILWAQGTPQAPIVCLDGDTRVDDDYLSALHRFFGTSKRWAGVLPYAHPIVGTTEEQAAILCYEFFLRYHALNLAWAGSPYGYHAIGSAMACTAEAYAAVSGMNRRQAGEDFYFLQQLAKTGKVELVPGTTVRLSGRASHRVPFGTGKRVQRFLDREQDEYRLYHPESYVLLKAWLETVAAHLDEAGDALLERAGGIDGELATFLEGQGFTNAWDRIQSQSKDEQRLEQAFHGWMDGFRTLKLLHHLRDTALPDAPMFKAIETLLERLGEEGLDGAPETLETDLAGQEALLERLRKQNI